MDAVKGRVRATTGSGVIRGAGIGGAIAASTGSGNIRMEQTAPGGAELTTGSGSIEISGVKGALRIETGSGSISAEGEPTSEWSLEAASGSVSVRVPVQAAFDFRARTASGRIVINHPLSVQGAIGRHEVQGKVRGGGPLLNIRTASGSIQVN